MIQQLNPPLPMETPKGGGWTHFVIDYGPESALLWVVFMDADGACWTVPNPEVRMSFNWTLGRRKTDDLAPTEEPARIGARTLQPFRPTLAARLRTRNESSEMKAEMIVIMPTTVRRWRENL